jgi:hypothetical protein
MLGIKFGKNKQPLTVVVATADTPRVIISEENARNAVKANHGTMEYKYMSQSKRDTLIRDEFLRLSMAAKKMPDGVITPEAISAYIAEKRRQRRLLGEWIEDQTEDDRRLTRIAAKHVLSCSFDPTRNFDLIPA